MDFENLNDSVFETRPKVQRKSKRRTASADFWLDDVEVLYEDDFEDDYKSQRRRKINWDAEQHARKSKKHKNRRPRQDEYDF